MQLDKLLKICEAPAGSGAHLLRAEGQDSSLPGLAHGEGGDSEKGKALLPYHGERSQGEEHGSPVGKS